MSLIVIHLPRNLTTETKSCHKPEFRWENGVTFLVYSYALFYPEANNFPVLAFKMHLPLLFWKFQDWELGVVLISCWDGILPSFAFYSAFYVILVTSVTNLPPKISNTEIPNIAVLGLYFLSYVWGLKFPAVSFLTLGWVCLTFKQIIGFCLVLFFFPWFIYSITRKYFESC